MKVFFGFVFVTTQHGRFVHIFFRGSGVLHPLRIYELKFNIVEISVPYDPCLDWLRENDAPFVSDLNLPQNFKMTKKLPFILTRI